MTRTEKELLFSISMCFTSLSCFLHLVALLGIKIHNRMAFHSARRERCHWCRFIRNILTRTQKGLFVINVCFIYFLLGSALTLVHLPNLVLGHWRLFSLQMNAAKSVSRSHLKYSCSKFFRRIDLEYAFHVCVRCVNNSIQRRRISQYLFIRNCNWARCAVNINISTRKSCLCCRRNQKAGHQWLHVIIKIEWYPIPVSISLVRRWCEEVCNCGD